MSEAPKIKNPPVLGTAGTNGILKISTPNIEQENKTVKNETEAASSTDTKGNDLILPEGKVPLQVSPNNQSTNDIAVALLAEFKALNNRLYLLGGQSPILVRADNDGKKTAYFQNATVDILRAEIENKIFVVQNKSTVAQGKWEVYSTILSFDLATLSQYFDCVDGIVSHPIMSKDGIAEGYGYNEQARLFINSPVTYSRMEVREAWKALKDIIADFPFADEASIFNAMALFFTFASRPCFDLCPIFLIKAPKEGTGKTLLVQAIIAAMTGRRAAINSMDSRNEAENEKLLTTVVKEGAEYLVIDNINERTEFNSPSLAKAVTTSIFSNRLLGSNSSISAPYNAITMMTGNNPRLSAEIARRCVTITLSNKGEDAEYRHPDLVDYCLQNHQKFVTAALAIVEHFKEAVYSGVKIDSFEQWSKVIGACMQADPNNHGESAFLSNHKEEWEEASDNQFDGYAEFLQAAKDKDLHSYTIKELLPAAIEYGIVDSAGSANAQCSALGKKLRAIDNRPFNGIAIQKQKRTGTGVSYKIIAKE